MLLLGSQLSLLVAELNLSLYLRKLDEKWEGLEENDGKRMFEKR